MSEYGSASELTFEDPVESLAREIQLYGMTGPAMMISSAMISSAQPYFRLR